MLLALSVKILSTLAQNLLLHDDEDEDNDCDCALHINAENAVAVSRWSPSAELIIAKWWYLCNCNATFLCVCLSVWHILSSPIHVSDKKWSLFASVSLFDTFYPHFHMSDKKWALSKYGCLLCADAKHTSHIYEIEKENHKRLKTVIWRNRKPEMQDLRIRFDISTSGFNNLIIFRSNLQSLQRSRIRRFRYKKTTTKSHSFVLTPHNKFSPSQHTCSQHIWKTKNDNISSWRAVINCIFRQF